MLDSSWKLGESFPGLYVKKHKSLSNVIARPFQLLMQSDFLES